MPLHRLRQIAGERSTGGAGEIAGWAGKSRQRPERASHSWQAGMNTLQPKRRREA